MAKKLHTLQDLLVHQLKDIYYAEKQLQRALGKMAKSATDETLREAFEKHRDETATHVERLEEAFGELGLTPRAVKCPAMDGLLKEANELLTETEGEPAVMDAALIASAQRVEHYEIAAYGCIRTYATQLGLTRIADLADETIAEEGQADKTLTQIAESAVNAAAIGDSEATV
ncbi:MAG TPA: ferritin-like domain-containing protein [Phycisphaerales bacterium]|nr:ferritin-like domain-containing protein [Phycisphaerales bacterium]